MTLRLRPSRVPIARRQLAARRGRTVAGIAGIAVALLLILAFRAIFAGIESRLTAYIDSTGADVIVAQQGVRTMHMTQSAVPRSTADEIARIPGVATAAAVLIKSAFVEGDGDKSGVVTLVGGGPTARIVSGRAPRAGEIMLDEALTAQLGVRIGDSVRVLGTPLVVSGQVRGTASLTGSFAFVPLFSLASILRSEGVASYVLVVGDGSVPPERLAERIESFVPAVTSSTRRSFVASEQAVVGEMSTDIVRAMILAGFAIGVAIAALVAYSQTLAQLRDYGVLRALGLGARRALGLVLVQVMTQVAAGFLLALLALAVLAAALPALSPTLVLTIRAGEVAEAAGIAVAVALVAATFPLVRVLRVEPASVYRRTT